MVCEGKKNVKQPDFHCGVIHPSPLLPSMVYTFHICDQSERGGLLVRINAYLIGFVYVRVFICVQGFCVHVCVCAWFEYNFEWNLIE